MSSILEKLSGDMAEMHSRVASSLIQIRRKGRPIGAGTIWSADGLIVTCAHVVEARGRGGPAWRSATSLSVVCADGHELAAQVLAADPTNDLAALKVDAIGLTPIPLGNSSSLRPGESLLAFGFPYGVDGGATMGVVVAPVGQLPESRRRDGDWLAASLHLRPGHSGGPMVDASGRLVGINTFMNGPDVGVAIPVHQARDFLRRVAEAGRQRAEQRGEQPQPTVEWV